MDDSKKTISKIIIFIFLVLFPFGQILRFRIHFLDSQITIHPIDIVAGISLILFLFKIKKFNFVLKSAVNFIIILTASYIFSLFAFNFGNNFIGVLYLLRIYLYASLFYLAYDMVKDDKRMKKLIYNSLISVSVFIAIFGWLQYFLYPDIRSFTVWGWDDHLYRLFGTFLDPGFTAILIVFGILLSLVKYFDRGNRKMLVPILFLLISLGFTYSRAGYLSLVGGVAVVLLIYKKIRYFIPLILAVFVLIPLLPRPSSAGVELERMFSVLSRLENYKETIKIWLKSPVFGVGYNNLCPARIRFLGKGDFLSHSCFGSDSSLLGLLAASGILGIISFIAMCVEALKSVSKKYFGISFIACFSSLLMHSLFVGSLFYPWIMGFMALLLAASINNIKESN